MKKNIQKCLIIGGMSFIFWLISFAIMGIVNNRSELSDRTQSEITESWSNQQHFIGPILCVPAYKDSLASTPNACMYILPERFEMDATLESETLHRGIFDASVYRTELSGKGHYDLKEIHQKVLSSGTNKQFVRYDWSNTQVIVAIGDKRGIEETVRIKIGDKELELNQRFLNFGNNDISSFFGSQYEPLCKIVDLTGSVGKENVSFELTSRLKGSSEFSVAPIGQSSVLTMNGNCKDPGFNGFVLPSDRTVTDDGFSACWKISSLNRNDVDQIFYSEKDNMQTFQEVGTKLLVKGGQYTQTDRALKYAFLVILLSLAAVLVSEMCVKSDINILNYLLIGAALVLFYLMLLSFGEWIGFTWSYFLSATLIIGMIALYLKAILKKANVALATCSFMALVDIFIFVLLSLESMALLAGTVGLFIILGAAMFFSLRFKDTLDKNKS